MSIKKDSNNNMSRDDDTPKSKLCCFGYVDYIVLASTLSVALAEELSVNDLNILASFFAVLSDELALIASVENCPDNDGSSDTDAFGAPVRSVAITSSDDIYRKNIPKKKKKTRIKKIIRKKIKKKKST